MMLLTKTDRLSGNLLPDEFQMRQPENPDAESADDGRSFKAAMRDHIENVESGMIVKCLEETDWNVTKAAKILGLSRKGLQLKMIRYNLRK